MRGPMLSDAVVLCREMEGNVPRHSTIPGRLDPDKKECRRTLATDGEFSEEVS